MPVMQEMLKDLKYIKEDKNFPIINTLKSSRVIFENTNTQNDAILGRIDAILQILNEKSQNGTIYDEDWYNKAIVQNQRFQDRLKKKLILGELDHPEEPGTSGHRVAFTLVSLERKGNEVWGKLEILNTPAGRILWTLVRAGVIIGFSLRGLGTDRFENGCMKIEGDNFEMKGWDAVVDPSFIKAEFKNFTESKREQFISDIKKENDKFSNKILEDIKTMSTTEKQEKNFIFENEQLRELNKKLELKIESVNKEILSLSRNNDSLKKLVEGKDLLLNSKEKMIVELKNTINKSEDKLKLMTEEVEERKLLVEKYKVQAEQKFIKENEVPKLEIFLNKKAGTTEDKKEDRIESYLKGYQYK